ncbi:hypothetical protein BJ322DRAFT_1220992 [Thelephora terrestris]|uniref:Uncharacterized protein n=1 Tax=Thelephora terrestris TaxID=56493 RepID=A0A9P6L2L2_9AGAM|nr:hypothetical protein BJ322DRAFT_1220992 [Thelephora terrestris]
MAVQLWEFDCLKYKSPVNIRLEALKTLLNKAPSSIFTDLENTNQPTNHLANLQRSSDLPLVFVSFHWIGYRIFAEARCHVCRASLIQKPSYGFPIPGDSVVADASNDSETGSKWLELNLGPFLNPRLGPWGYRTQHFSRLCSTPSNYHPGNKKRGAQTERCNFMEKGRLPPGLLRIECGNLELEDVAMTGSQILDIASRKTHQAQPWFLDTRAYSEGHRARGIVVVWVRKTPHTGFSPKRPS